MKEIIESIEAWKGKEVLAIADQSAILHMDDALIAVLFMAKGKPKMVLVTVKRIYSDRARAIVMANFREVMVMARKARADNLQELESTISQFIEEHVA